jgi:hypothetical protein
MLRQVEIGRHAPRITPARGRGWTAEPSPHLAFRNASPPLRLYTASHLDAAEYARRSEEGDLERVGAHARADVRGQLWPWLKGRGYATEVAGSWKTRAYDRARAQLHSHRGSGSL